MNVTNELLQDLRANLSLYQELLAVIEAEGRALRQAEDPSLFSTFSARKGLLPRLTESLGQLRKHRAQWQTLDPAERARHPEAAALLRQNQDSIMKIILLDRENEQGLLRRGLVPPRELPSVNRQRPHFVADLYRRQAKS
ncbi:MAG: hypothetical protein H7X97_04470 [Opitutaceae bacterium]|nr:hypothetical protein [Verrucomicrobiales bacterium]